LNCLATIHRRENRSARAAATRSHHPITEIWQLLVLSFALGWFLSPVQAAVVTIVQQGTPDEELGRVMAVLQAAMSATSVLSMGFAGIAGDAIGIREVFFVAGAIVFVAGAIVAGGFVFAVLGYRGRAAEPMPRAHGGETANVG
jgi:MFS family permease